jgi:hypothetical protein
MNPEVVGLLVVLGVGGAAALFAARKGPKLDPAWNVLVTCPGCGKEIPRWFLMDKSTPRGPYGRYRFPIPESCRICRHTRGIRPTEWREGESEAEYDKRSEAAVAARFQR